MSKGSWCKRVTAAIVAAVLLCAGAWASALTMGPPYGVQSLTDHMVRDNTQLRKLREQVYQAGLDVKDAKAGFSPQIDLQVTGTYMFNPPIGPITVNGDDLAAALGIPTAGGGGYITIYEGMENTLYNFSLSVTQPLVTWGKLTNAVRLYEGVQQVRNLNLDSTQDQLAVELRTRLDTAYYLHQILSLLDEQQGYADRLVSIAQEGERNGMITQQQLLEARIQAKGLSVTKLEVSGQARQMMLALQSLTGIADLSWEQVSYEPDSQLGIQLLQQEYQSMQSRAISLRQPSLQMLTLLQGVSETAQTIAEASVYWKPDLALVVNLGYGGSRFPLIEKDWYGKDDYTANLTIAVKTTVWDGGKKLNAIKQAKSATVDAAIDTQAARLTISQTLAEQWQALDIARETLEYLVLKQQVAQSKVAQQQVLMDTGYGEEQAYLQAQVDECAVRIDMQRQLLNMATAANMVDYLCKDPSGF